LLGPTRTVDTHDHPPNAPGRRFLVEPGTNDDDRTKCMADALFADRANKKALEPTDPSGPDDEEIRLSAGTRQCHSWYVDVALTPNRKRGLASDDQAESVVDHRLCGGLLIRAFFVPSRQMLWCSWTCVDHPNSRSFGRRIIGSPLDRQTGILRAIDPHQDRPMFAVRTRCAVFFRHAASSKP
jgi:hypothetical protein